MFGQASNAGGVSQIWHSFTQRAFGEELSDDMLTELQAEDIHAHNNGEPAVSKIEPEIDYFVAYENACGNETALRKLRDTLHARRSQQVGTVLHHMRTYSDLVATCAHEKRRLEICASQVRSAILALHRLCYVRALPLESGLWVPMHDAHGCRGKVGETILHIAYLFKLYDIARFILEIDPSMVARAYLKEPYEGETILHILAAQGEGAAEEACGVLHDLCLGKPGTWLYPHLSTSELAAASRYSLKFRERSVSLSSPAPCTPGGGTSVPVHADDGRASPGGFSPSTHAQGQQGEQQRTAAAAVSQKHVNVLKQLYRRSSWHYVLHEYGCRLPQPTQAGAEEEITSTQAWCKRWVREAWVRLVNARATGRFFKKPPEGTCFYGCTPASIAAVLGHAGIVHFLAVEAGKGAAAGRVAPSAAEESLTSSTGGRVLKRAMSRMQSFSQSKRMLEWLHAQGEPDAPGTAGPSERGSHTDSEPRSPQYTLAKPQSLPSGESTAAGYTDRSAFPPVELQLDFDPTLTARLDTPDAYGNSVGHMAVYHHELPDIFRYVSELYHLGYGRGSTVCEYTSPAAQWARAVVLQGKSTTTAEPHAVRQVESGERPEDRVKLGDLCKPRQQVLSTFRGVRQCYLDMRTGGGAGTASSWPAPADVTAFLAELAKAGQLKAEEEQHLEAENLHEDIQASNGSLQSGATAWTPRSSSLPGQPTPPHASALARAGAVRSGVHPSEALVLVPIEPSSPVVLLNPMRAAASLPSIQEEEAHGQGVHGAMLGHARAQSFSQPRAATSKRYKDAIARSRVELAHILSRCHRADGGLQPPSAPGPIDTLTTTTSTPAHDEYLDTLIAECARMFRKSATLLDGAFSRGEGAVPSDGELALAMEAFLSCYLAALDALKAQGASSGERVSLLDLVNEDGLTPLTLAASLGKKAMFESLLRGTGRVTWARGDVRAMCFPLEQVDDIGHVADAHPDIVRAVYDRDRGTAVAKFSVQAGSRGKQQESQHAQRAPLVHEYPTALAVAVRHGMWQLLEPKSEAQARLARQGRAVPLPASIRTSVPPPPSLSSDPSPTAAAHSTQQGGGETAGHSAGPVDTSEKRDDLDGSADGDLEEDESLLVQLVERKWKRLYRAQFRWLLLRRLALILFAWCTAIVRSGVPDNAKPVFQCATHASASCSASQVLVPLLLLVQCTKLLHALLRSWGPIRSMCASRWGSRESLGPGTQWSRGMTAFSVSHGGSFGLYHTCTLGMTVLLSIAATGIDVALGWRHANIFYAISGAAGGAHMIWFLVGFGHTGPLLIMLGQVMATQFTRWLYLFVPTIMLFAFALFVLDSLPAGQGASYGFLSYLRTYMLGAIDGSFNPDSSAAIVQETTGAGQGTARAYGLATENAEAGRAMYLLFYLALLFISFVALLSLLIALLSHAFTEYLSTPKARWRVERARACILLETSLSPQERLQLPAQRRYFVWLPHSGPGQAQPTLASSTLARAGITMMGGREGETRMYRPYFFSQSSSEGQHVIQRSRLTFDGKRLKQE